jgi:transmembrane sensor
MPKNEDKEKIERFVEGKSAESEKEWAESLFLKGEENSTLRNFLEKDWNRSLFNDSTPEVNLSHLLDRVHHIIRKSEILKQQSPLQKIIRIYMRAAAILLIPLLIAGGLTYTYFGNRTKTTTDRLVSSTIYAPLGARVSFSLPDGSSGMLNSGSHLSYSIPFSSNRNVTLEGEAWFNISHDESHPFEISTGSSTVKVLGTSFNMSAYPEENYVEVVLQQGEVEFSDNKGDEKVIILPSERLIFQNGNISKSMADPAKYNAWTTGKLVFRGDLMEEVARRIERWYNVKVELANKELNKYSFRATFEDDKLEDVLRFLSMTSPIRYQISTRKFLTDGTYEKEKVTIYMKKSNTNL